MISITVEGRDRDEWQLAAKMLKIIEEAQPNVKERLGFGPSETKEEEDFHIQLVDAVAKKVGKKVFKEDYAPDVVFLPEEEGDREQIPFKDFISMILQFEEEAADEIFGDE